RRGDSCRWRRGPDPCVAAPEGGGAEARGTGAAFYATDAALRKNGVRGGTGARAPIPVWPRPWGWERRVRPPGPGWDAAGPRAVDGASRMPGALDWSRADAG